MTLDLSRRSFLRGLVAAPAVIAYDRLMPVRLIDFTAPELIPLPLNEYALGFMLTLDEIIADRSIRWDISRVIKPVFTELA